MWDVLKSWQTNLGLYKFSSGADYDTTIYLTAYNGIGTLRNLDSSDVVFFLHDNTDLLDEETIEDHNYIEFFS